MHGKGFLQVLCLMCTMILVSISLHFHNVACFNCLFNPLSSFFLKHTLLGYRLDHTDVICSLHLTLVAQLWHNYSDMSILKNPIVNLWSNVIKINPLEALGCLV